MQPTGEWLNQAGGLAERLQRMRTAAGLTGERMAAQLGWTRTKISKLENGRQMPTATDIASWARACGREDASDELLAVLDEAKSVHRQYRHQLRQGHAALQEDLDNLVRQAKRIRNIEVAVVPGLLQTADYARYRMREAVRVHGFEPGGVEAAVAARMHRQEILYDGEREFQFVITEAALRLRLCPPAVMLGQVDRLMSLSGLENIWLGIVPFDIELSVAPMLAFMVLDKMTYVETHTSHDFVYGRESTKYAEIADGLAAESVTGDAARQLLMSAAEKLRGGHDPRSQP